MKIKMLTLASGPLGSYLPGEVYDIPKEVAVIFIKLGYAVAEEKKREMAIEKPEETRTVEEAPKRKTRKK